MGLFSKEDVVLAPEYEQRSGGILVVSPPGTCAIMAVINLSLRDEMIEGNDKTHSCRLSLTDEESI